MPKKNERMLDEVVVKATKLKFYMDGDTLVYDADAFNLAEGSMLGELMKKLPGVEVEHDAYLPVRSVATEGGGLLSPVEIHIKGYLQHNRYD